MNDYQSPWQILGLAPGAGLDAIRRAYAKKLKTVRPDEDPAGFQRLREARDQAQQQQAWYDSQPEEPDWDDEEENEEAAAGGEVFEASAEAEESPQPPVRIIEEEPAGESATAADAAKTFVVAEDVGEPTPRETIPLLIRETERAGDDPQALDGEAADEFDIEELDDRIEHLFGPWGERWNFDNWWKLLADMGRLGFDERRWLEERIIVALARPRNGEQQRIATPEERRRRARVLTLLDEEFGWLAHDRKLYAVIDAKEADRLLNLLRTSRREAQRADELKDERGGVPFLSEEDLLAYFERDEDPRTIDYYRRSYAAGRWRWNWHWSAGFGNVIWSLWRGMWMHSLLLVGLAACAVAIEAQVDRVVPELASPVLVLLLLGLFVLPGLMGRRWLIRRAYLASLDADAKNLFDPAPRREFLRKRGKRSGWWLVALIYVGAQIVRVVMTLNEPPKPPPKPVDLFKNFDIGSDGKLRPKLPPDLRLLVSTVCPIGDEACRDRVVRSEQWRKVAAEMLRRRQAADKARKEQQGQGVKPGDADAPEPAPTPEAPAVKIAPADPPAPPR